MDYVNLHVHSEHSLLDGAAKISNLAKTAKDRGHSYLALTDHGSMAGSLAHKKACEKAGIRPIYGCELYLMEDLAKAKEGIYQSNLHLTAIAKNQRGFEKLLAGLNWANQHGTAKSGRFRRAFLSPDYPLKSDWAGDIVILSGCSSSPFYNLSNSEAGIELMKTYFDVFKEDFYGELMPLHDWEAQKTLNEIVIDVSKELGFKLVCTNDIHYCHEDEHELHELVLCLGQWGMTWNSEKRWKFSTHLNYFRSAESMIQSLTKMGADEKWAIGAVSNTREVAEKAHFELKKYPLDLPSILPAGEDEEYYMHRLAIEGLRRRGKEGIEEYERRLIKEEKIIADKGFTRYMLIVADVLNWAKAKGIFVGPGRGSVGGSLLAYCLGITDIDPIPYGLSFERFVAPDRADLPDIDCDIADSQRKTVETYLREKYGNDNVAHVITYSTALGRGALRDVSRVFEVPLAEADAASKLIIKRPEGDPRALMTIHDTLEESEEFRSFRDRYPKPIELASKLEGQIRGTGTHAGGFVITSDSLANGRKAYLIDGEHGRSVNWDKDDLEFFGMVKIDLLGLSTHSVIAEALRLIESSRGIKIELDKLPLNDDEVYKAIGRGDTATMFQLSAIGTGAYCRELKPDRFEDIAAILALWRPGPIQAGMAKDYVEIKFGRKEPSYLCEEHREVAEETRGQLIYQEQLSELLMKLAGFSYVEADKVRKIVAKKLGTGPWQEMGEKFVAGCLAKKTLSEEVSRRLWKQLEGWANYAFNKSHASAYGLVAYWTAWLKIHYPAEWLCAYLNYGSVDRENKDGETNLELCLKEASKLGIKILPPDISKSFDSWSVEDGKNLRAGLKEIVGVGDKTRIELAQVRTAQSFASFIGAVNRRIVNKRVIRSMVFAGALESLHDQDWSLWRKNFDELYENLGTKKFDAALEKARQMPNATVSEQFLNYDPEKISAAGKAGEQIVSILGTGYRLQDGIIIQESDGIKWAVSDAVRCIMPGLNREILTRSNVGIKEIQKDTKSCSACRLRQTCTRPVPIAGGILSAMVVAEAPGAYEDRSGKPLIGQSGQLLFNLLEEVGLDRTLFYVDNVVHCRPPGNKLGNTPKETAELIAGCPHLKRALFNVKPKAVLALGNKPLYFFKGKESGIMKYNGMTEWNTDYQCWITYGVHPAVVLHSDREGMYEKLKICVNEFKRVVLSLLGG